MIAPRAASAPHVLYAAALSAGVLCLLVPTACGRSSPTPCRVHEGLTCAGLTEERMFEQADFDAAIATDDADAAHAEGTCVAQVVAEQLERNCIADPCAELCSLHPCALAPDRAGEACADACRALTAELGLPAAALEQAVIGAARRPGLCSCAACDDAAGVLCERLWGCPAPAAAP